MPKLIDHDARREEFAEATWRVILRDGIAGTSIRTVAAEAGHSAGSLRHVFKAKDDLLVAAIAVIERRITARIESRLGEPDARLLVRAVACELFPLDEVRLAEMEVYNALVAEAPSNERLRDERDATHRELRAVGRQLIQYLAEQGLVADGVDLDLKALAFSSLIDGLAVELLVHPDNSERAFACLDDFIDSLAPVTKQRPAQRERSKSGG